MKCISLFLGVANLLMAILKQIFNQVIFFLYLLDSTSKNDIAVIQFLLNQQSISFLKCKQQVCSLTFIVRHKSELVSDSCHLF